VKKRALPRKITFGDRQGTERGRSELLPRLADLPPGTRLGAYELEQVAGRGGMGVVYCARHVHLDRRVALKLLLPELAADTAFREGFLRESRIAASLDHPNVIPVYDAGEADGLLYIAMKFLDGSDLATVLEREGPLEPERALELLAGVASGLDAAHALGLVHRDVKPANILCDVDRFHITDFGLTRAAGGRRFLREVFAGTIDYVAPEQIEGRPLDGRADVYALACVLYQTLAGTPPFADLESRDAVLEAHLTGQAPPLTSHRPSLPRELDAVVARALAKSADDRHATCSALVAAARIAADDSVTAGWTPAVDR